MVLKESFRALFDSKLCGVCMFDNIIVSFSQQIDCDGMKHLHLK